MITSDGVIQPINEDDSNRFYGDVIGWCHQCWQLYVGEAIDLVEYKRRLNVDNIDYRQFMVDYAEQLNQQPDNDKVYVQRVIDSIYTE
jgi:hypothetical protein